jgi:hypothetical protein
MIKRFNCNNNGYCIEVFSSDNKWFGFVYSCHKNHATFGTGTNITLIVFKIAIELSIFNQRPYELEDLLGE